MRIKTMLLAAATAASLSAHAQITETATQAVSNMGLGWNLGNTLDAATSGAKDPSSADYWHAQGLESENYWGQPTTTADLIVMMKNAGFGAIRVPVTWYNHMQADGTVDPQWMARVKEVVNYVVDNGLYCILNVHHDTGADSDSHISWIKASTFNYSSNHARYESLWRQIATEFRDYGNLLLFEAYNEMLDVNNSWCFAAFSAPSYTTALANDAYSGLNSYAQSFVNTVRATGGNNATRNLVVNTYAAANGYGSCSNHLLEPLTRMQMPTDSATGHIAFEVHDYPNITQISSSGTVSSRSFASIKQQVDQTISLLKSNLPAGAPVIIGEWGTSNVDASETDYQARRDLYLQFASYYVSAHKAAGNATFHWMGLSDGIYRSAPAFNQPDLAEALAKAYHGSSFVGQYPELQPQAEHVIYEGSLDIANWKVQQHISADIFKLMGSDVQLEITYLQQSNSDNIQLYYADWSVKPTFSADGKSYPGDLNSYNHYGTSPTTQHTLTISFTPAVYAKLSTLGLVVFGNAWRLLKLRLVTPTTAIALTPEAGSATRTTIFNLHGQPVANPVPGNIYIVNGKKVLQK